MMISASSFLNQSAKGGTDTIAIIMMQYFTVLVKKMCMHGVRGRITMNLYYDDLTIISMSTFIYDHMILFGVIIIQDSSLFR